MLAYRNRKVHLLDVALAVLFLGPIISPLFRASALPVVSDAGWLARDLLSRFVCPTPDQSYMLLGMPMAVCARCWGATIGLLAARWLAVARRSGGQRALGWLQTLPWPQRLALCGLPFLLWPLEIVGTSWGWWSPPLGLLLLNGVQAGLAGGLFFATTPTRLAKRLSTQRHRDAEAQA